MPSIEREIRSDLTTKADFKQIDRIALKLGLDQESNQRIKSGIKYALKISTNNGHCCVLYENLLQFCHEYGKIKAVDSENTAYRKGKEEKVCGINSNGICSLHLFCPCGFQL